MSSEAVGTPEEQIDALKKALYDTTVALQQALPTVEGSWKKQRSEQMRQQLRAAVTAGLMQKAQENVVAASRGDTEAAKKIDEAPLSTEAFAALLMRNETQASDAAKKEGVLETHPVIVAADLIYIAAAFVLCSLTIAMLHTKTTSFASDSNKTITFVVDVILQIFTWVWMLLQCFIQRKDGWDIIVNRKSIAMQYAKERLAFDLIYAFPLEWAFMSQDPDMFRYFGWISVRNGLRFLRMFDMTWSNNPLLGRRSLMQFSAFLSFAMFSCAAIAAIFWSLEDGISFIDSVYWAAMTVTTTGYGDIHATHKQSKIFSFVVMFFGICLISLLSGWATKLLVEANRIQKQMDDDKELLHSMLEFYQVPWNIRRELIALFPLSLEKRQAAQFKNMMDTLPGAITKKVERYAEAHFLRVVPLFNEEEPDRPTRSELTAVHDGDLSIAQLVSMRPALPQPAEALPRIAALMQRRFCLSDAVVTIAGEIGGEMYFLLRGTAQAVRHVFKDKRGDVVLDTKSTDIVSCEQEDIGAPLGVGAFFGAAALAQHPYAATVITTTVVELGCFTREALNTIRQSLPAVADYLVAELGVPTAPWAETMNKDLRMDVAATAAAASVGDAANPLKDAEGPPITPTHVAEDGTTIETLA